MNYKEYAKSILTNMTTLSKHVTIRNMSDISKGEMAILGYLHFVHDGACAGELSEASCVVSSRIAAVLNALEKKEYAERRPDCADKRKVLVYITPKGRKEVLDKYNEVMDEVAGLLEVLGKEDVIAMERIVKKIVEYEENKLADLCQEENRNG